MSYVIIGGNYYDHISDYLFAPSYGYMSYGYSEGSIVQLSILWVEL